MVDVPCKTIHNGLGDDVYGKFLILYFEKTEEQILYQILKEIKKGKGISDTKQYF